MYFKLIFKESCIVLKDKLVKNNHIKEGKKFIDKRDRSTDEINYEKSKEECTFKP
jgi:hypothetical protein